MGVKVGLNYLKKVALLFRFKRDILADGAQVIGHGHQVVNLFHAILVFLCKST
jgi:hypothetical protein